MRRLIYISRSLIDSDVLEAIVSLSSVRNRRVGVAGLLWASDGCFAKALEGEAEAVGLTMNGIGGDARHTDVDVLFNRAVLNRQFGDWSMRSADDGEAAAFMLGLALSQRGPAAEKLRQIVLASI